MLEGIQAAKIRFSPTISLTFSNTKGRVMSKVKASFDAAVAASKSLPEKPDNATLLKLYALYKQATDGDVEGKRPGFTTWWAAPSSTPGRPSRARQMTRP